MKSVLQCSVCNTRTLLVQTREHIVCNDCGLVLDNLFENDNIKKKHSKAYYYLHHFNERMAAFTGTGPEVKDNILLCRIRLYMKDLEEKFGSNVKWGPQSFVKVIKYLDRKFFCNFSKHKYHERWIWMRHELGIEPLPTPSDTELHNMQARYMSVYEAFEYIKKNLQNENGLLKKRNNIININFIILNILKQQDLLHVYGKYFSHVKGLLTNHTNLIRYWKILSYIMRKVFNENFWDKEIITSEEIKEVSVYI